MAPHGGTADKAPRWLPFLTALLIVAIPAALDAMVFRSGLYRHAVEPESTAGMTLLALRNAEFQYRPDMRNVLVMGDSRVGEGVSARIANETAHPRGINFVTIGISGSTPRVWNYVLRELDPQRNRFDSILLMATSLRDDQTHERLADRQLDTAYLAPILGLADIKTYTDSFDDPKLRREAAYAIGLPEIPMQRDLQNFLRTPGARLHKVKVWQDYPAWYRDYPGKQVDMPDIPVITPTQLEPNITANVDPQTRREIIDYFKEWTGVNNASIKLASSRYRLAWYGSIAENYRGSSTNVIVFAMPRGPYHAALGISNEPEGALSYLESIDAISLLSVPSFHDFETSQYFADVLHMNRRGREAFSAELSRSLPSEHSRRQ